MKIEFGGRATGKTVRMLRELDGREDAILLCLNTRICHIMKLNANQIGCLDTFVLILVLLLKIIS